MSTLALVEEAKAYYPDLQVGVNILGWPAGVIMGRVSPEIWVWSDDGDLEGVDEAKKDGWKGLYFAGAAFKGQPQVSLKNIPKHVARLNGHVVTTSGPRTGVPADVEKIRVFREALGPKGLLAVASGITPENVGDFVEDVDIFLVATGIESSFGCLDPDRTKALVDTVHAAKSCPCIPFARMRTQ